MTNLALKFQPAKPILTIEHMASSNPFYYVEEAEIGHSTVSVSFFDENNPDSEIQNEKISTKALIEFTNAHYRSYEDKFDAEFGHYQSALPEAGIDYLRENLKAVCTEYLNQKEA